ncbi:MAG: DUF3137 domain-containing protein [Ignavibacteriaceae bacterium]|jgi:hypothetical protein|nr:DUF3137 domain-containing protein [Ignavibacteriaceae bacterium]
MNLISTQEFGLNNKSSIHLEIEKKERFKAFYEAEILPFLKDLEVERKRSLPLYFFRGIYGFALALFIIPTVFNTFIDLVLDMGGFFGGNFSDSFGNTFLLIFRILFSSVFVFILLVFIYIFSAKSLDFLSRHYKLKFTKSQKLLYSILLGAAFLIIIRLINMTPYSFNLYRISGGFESGDNSVFWHTFKWFFIIIGSAIILAPLMILIQSREDKFVKKFKNGVVKKIVLFTDPKLNYLPDKVIPKSEFMDSKIPLGNPDSKYLGGDFVSGKRGDVEFRFSQINAKARSQSSKSNDEVNVFQGIMFICRFNKPFTKEHFVLPDVAAAALGVTGESLQKLNPCRPPLVRLENIEFEKEFAVYSQDEIECRYILSLSFMERIIALRKKSSLPFSMSFVNSNLYLAVSYDRDVFRPPVFFSQINFDRILEMYEDILFYTGIVDDLNLNLKIWGD